MRPIQANRSLYLKAVVVFLLMLALVDSYTLTRAYVARNADAVAVVTTSYYNARPSLPGGKGQQVKGIVTQHFTGAIARRMQEAIDTYPYYQADVTKTPSCIGSPGDEYFYAYRFTFTLLGVVVEEAQGSDAGCSWTRTALGVTERATFVMYSGGPFTDVYKATNCALPTSSFSPQLPPPCPTAAP
ncbi:MAG: hypothetical protein ACRDHE_06895 [Ktedonobacterales bacterium]